MTAGADLDPGSGRSDGRARQVARWLDDELNPRGVGVVLEAEHTCMTLRGVAAHGATTVTSALLGELRDDARSRNEFLALAGHRTG